MSILATLIALSGAAFWCGWWCGARNAKPETPALPDETEWIQGYNTGLYVGRRITTVERERRAYREGVLIGRGSRCAPDWTADAIQIRAARLYPLEVS